MSKRKAPSGASRDSHRDPKRMRPTPATPGLVLSAKQNAVLRFVTEHPTQSVFVTGGGGCGKSVVLRAIIDALSKKKGVVASVTASTGLAAVEVGGVTLHSFSGLGHMADAEITDAELDTRIRKMYDAQKKAIRAVTDLVIEEISMVSTAFFDTCDRLFRRARPGHAHEPMGGIRLLIFGDFFQLPPVRDRDRDRSGGGGGGGVDTRPLFAFEAAAWRALRPRVFELDEDFRHAESDTYAHMMHEIRRGVVSPSTAAALSARVLPPPIPDATTLVTSIFPRNRDVDAINLQRLRALPGAARTFLADDALVSGQKVPTATDDTAWITRLFDKTRALAVLTLKEGAQVMLTRNLSIVQTDGTALQLANGMVGRVVSFDPLTGNPCVSFPPWHAAPLAIQQEKWEIRKTAGDPLLATRFQLPLQLAYAISAHKSQGQTISCAVEADLASAFEPGMAYVILSRVKRIDQLYLRNFNPAGITAHPKVLAFYANLGSDAPPDDCVV